MSEQPLKIDVDFFAQDFHHHPLASEILTIASEKGIDLKDIKSVAEILEVIKDAQHSDPKVILILALFLEALVNFSEASSLHKVLATADLDEDTPVEKND